VEQFVTPSLLLTVVLVLSIFGSLLVAILLVVIQFALEMRNMARLKRLKYAKSNELVVCSLLSDPEAFHLFLSYAWPTAQDRMCIVKQRFAEVLPSCRVFLDVDAHISRRSGPRSTRESSQRDEQSTVRQIDSSGCILVRAPIGDRMSASPDPLPTAVSTVARHTCSMGLHATGVLHSVIL
jgi:hypothetical protein